MRSFRLALVLSGGLFFPLAVSAQYNPGFVATRAVPVGGTPWAFATADLNHDGIQDVVIADGSTTTVDASGASHTTINGIAVLIGKGGGAFQQPVRYATSDSASFVAVADVDGNGSQDVVTASDDPSLASPGGSVQVLKNNGDGTYGAAAKYSFPGWIASSAIPGDLNGDGYVDLTVALSNSSTGKHATQYLLNNGNGTFRFGTLTVGEFPVAVADFNHDGKLEVAALFYSSSNQVSFGIISGSGTENPKVGILPIDSNFAVTVGDMNGDGYADLILISNNSPVITLLLNSKGGWFTTTFLVNGINATGAAAGDFNHDGIADFALVDAQSSLYVLFGRRDGTFAFPARYKTSGTGLLGVNALEAVDLNNDGILDLATTTPTGSFVPIFGKPGGTFNAGTEIPLAPGLVNISTVTADFNNDGIPDIAELNYLGPPAAPQQPVSFYMGDGTGRFKLSTTKTDPGFAASTMAAGDVNHDGIADLVFLNQVDASNNSELAVLLGKGDGTFEAPQYFGAIPHCCANTPFSSPIYLADINNDGKPDVVTAFGVHLGNGDGTFGPAIPLPDANYIFALGDFNKDGKFDLVTLSDERSPVVTIYAGNGTGRFPTALYSDTLPFGDLQANSLVVGRFTKDGNLGVVAGAADQFYPDGNVVNNGAFSLLAGNGNGTLKAPVVYQLPFELAGFAIGDFNDDGIDDVAAFNGANLISYSSHVVSLFTSKGDGTLLPPFNLGAGGGGVVADFNRDGAVDIAGSGRDAVDILMNSRGTSVSFTATPTSVLGHAVVLRCAVSASFRLSGALFGRVAFYDGTNLLATGNLYGNVATIDYFGLPVGTHSLTAVYLGNGSYNAHRSSPVTINVTR